jgi:hypothetical protein
VNDGSQHSEPGAGQQEVRWDRFASVWRNQQSDRVSPVRARTTGLALGLWTAAAVALFVGWNGASVRSSVELQLPYLITTGLFVLAAGLGGIVVHAAGVVAGGPRLRATDDHDDDAPADGSEGSHRRSSSDRASNRRRPRRRQLVAAAGVGAIGLGVAAPLPSAEAADETPQDALDAFVDAFDDYAAELDAAAVDLRFLHASGPLGRSSLELHTVRSQVEIAPVLARLLDSAVAVAGELGEGRLATGEVGEAVRDPLTEIASSTARSGRLATELLDRASESGGKVSTREEHGLDPNDLLVPVYQLSVEVLQPILAIIESAEPALAPLADVFGAACLDGLGLVQLGLNAAPALLQLPELPVDVAQLVSGGLTPVFLVCSALPTPEAAPGDGQSGGSVALPPPPSSEPPTSDDGPVAPPPSTTAASPLTTELSPAPDVDPSPPATSAGEVVDVGELGEVDVDSMVHAVDPVLVGFDRSIEQAGILAVIALCAAAAAAVRRWRPEYGWEVSAGAAALVASLGAAVLAWHGVASYATSWIQLTYVLSGVGAALLLGMVGTALVSTPFLESVSLAGGPVRVGQLRRR